MNNTITTDYRIEHLTKPEHTKLKKMVLGYGNFKRVAASVEVHPNTLRNIINLGYATPDIIKKVRPLLQSYNAKS